MVAIQALTHQKKGKINIRSPEVQALLKKKKDQDIRSRYVPILEKICQDIEDSASKIDSISTDSVYGTLISETNEDKDAREEFTDRIVALLKGFAGAASALAREIKEGG